MLGLAPEVETSGDVSVRESPKAGEATRTSGLYQPDFAGVYPSAQLAAASSDAIHALTPPRTACTSVNPWPMK